MNTVARPNIAITSQETELFGWGRFPRTRARLITPDSIEQLSLIDEPHLIARGQGRSYGTAATLDGGAVLSTRRLDGVLSFNPETGALTAEPGITLAEIIERFLPLGWFPPATPGTRHVSLGGCVAADVHGKGHHREGSFGAHVTELEMLLTNGERRRCSRSQLPELFWATISGMGLTGVITEVSVQLQRLESPFFLARHHAASSLEELIDMFQDPAIDDHYSVSWIDCSTSGKNLGRGVYITAHNAGRDSARSLGEHIRGRTRLTVPFDMPAWVMNSFTNRLFNAIYYRAQGRKTEPFIVDYDSFFYPLDRITNWNLLYGKQGFVQYQCVIPDDAALVGLRRILTEVSQSGRASFLAVLKRFGPEGQGMLSFPMAGFTLALDLPVAYTGTFELLTRLDRIVLEYGGRVYLAKEARLDAATFRAMYPRLGEWQHVKAIYDPGNRWTSDLGRQLEIS